MIGVFTAAVAFAVANLPAVSHQDSVERSEETSPVGKAMYMAAGSGIPEIKTILLFPKYRDNGRKMREMLSVACSAGLSVAFGAPIGGVLFSYESVLIDCRQPEGSWICAQEGQDYKTNYYGWLLYGTSVKLILTIITFGCKVPSGIIIPALDAGALFGRLVGQAIPDISPGIFAMVGAAAFLAGISRMTVSLAVIMFELTGEVDYIPPFMIAILIAKWVADALSSEGVYDLAQTVLGHPFLDPDHALHIVRNEGSQVEELIPPPQTMNEITVDLPADFRVPKSLLATKLTQLKARGLMDAGVVLVQNGMLHGYLAEAELDFVLSEPCVLDEGEEMVDLLQGPIAAFVDRTPLTVCGKAPMEVAVQMFGALGLRYLVVVAEGSGRVEGVVIKKRLVWYLEGLKGE
ncbi:putative H(+)/Cl(-) exchange transporter 3 [Glarea lozoyensis 74030]|uniref:Putative H(+)/Cl(-) exchange transporter 3 n=1 Tax=Glarea lozoyensis (strain ATCC 74030 / MF5533) TaxID=1104152 RepID=H0ERM6_GLAL7|nr:putative H(+)/Cl(-) exchange transporter 3 [Glarea lozoyensis 74030]